MKQIYDVIIVGGGPGGYTCALYCARAGLRTLVLEKKYIGGQMTLSPEIDNYPGFDNGIDGVTLGMQMQNGAHRFGAHTVLAEVVSLQPKNEIKEIKTTEDTFLCRCIVLAMGTTHRELGLPNEKALIGHGVSYCATCDGYFFKGKDVVVVGGGNTAVADVLYLSRFCRKVFLVHRKDTLRASQIYHQQLKNTPNLQFYGNHQVAQFLYEQNLTGVKIRHIHTNKETTLTCQGIFIAIGQKPATDLVKTEIKTDENGYILADETTQTNLPGVFAVGDLRTKKVRQIVTAVADGAVASYYAEKYLKDLKCNPK